MSNKSNKPWLNFPEIWKTESAYMSFIRGGIRKALWNRYPVKTSVIQKQRKRIPNPNPRGKVATVWGGECYLCHNDFVQKDLQVDHLIGNHSLKTINDIQPFIEGLLFITEDDLALVCKECHAAKSMADKQGISFEEAKVKKKIIALMKDKKYVNSILTKYNLPCQNDSVRKESLRKLIEQNKLEE